MIEVDHLAKRFGRIEAITDVSFRIAPGSIVGFLGPNGAGKTTTLRILTGVFPPTSGSARVCGFDVSTDSMAVRERVGYLPESNPLPSDLSVMGLLRYVARLKGLPAASRSGAVSRVLDLCGLEAVASRTVGKLSKGYRQRVGLAQALLGDPPVVILDEPMAGLDPEQVQAMRALIGELRGARTVLLSSHVLAEVSLLCDEVIVIHEGVVLAQDTPEALGRRLNRAVRVRLRLDAPVDEAMRLLEPLPMLESLRATGAEGTVAFEVPDEEALREVARCVAAAGWLVLEMRQEAVSLEEAFLELVRERAGGSP